MAKSRRQVIKDAAKAALLGNGGPEGLKVHFEPRRPLDEDELPAIVVYSRTEEKVEETHDGSVLRRLILRAEHRQKGRPETPGFEEDGPDELLDPLINWATLALLSGSALAGLIQEIGEVGIEWADPVEAKVLYAGAGQDYEILYWTAREDQTVAG
jgi:hypothetical protein